MTLPHILAFLALLAAGANARAAFWWIKASQVSIPHTDVSVSDVPAMHILGAQVAIGEAAHFSAKAAFWGAWSAGLATIIAVVAIIALLTGTR